MGKYACSQICTQGKACLLCAGTKVQVGAEICILIPHEVNIHSCTRMY